MWCVESVVGLADVSVSLSDPGCREGRASTVTRHTARAKHSDWLHSHTHTTLGAVLAPWNTMIRMSRREPMWVMGRDGDVKGLSRLLDEGVDPAAPEECDGVSRVVCASVSHG